MKYPTNLGLGNSQRKAVASTLKAAGSRRMRLASDTRMTGQVARYLFNTDMPQANRIGNLAARPLAAEVVVYQCGLSDNRGDLLYAHFISSVTVYILPGSLQR